MPRIVNIPKTRELTFFMSCEQQIDDLQQKDISKLCCRSFSVSTSEQETLHRANRRAAPREELSSAVYRPLEVLFSNTFDTQDDSTMAKLEEVVSALCENSA